MKKVISALTAAAMCASMSASVMTAFAVYTANDIEFYLKIAEAPGGTISADGTKVTFPDAATAKASEIVVQQYIKVADISNPSVQLVNTCYQVDDALNFGKVTDVYNRSVCKLLRLSCWYV